MPSQSDNHEITYSVDGEEFTTHSHMLTAGQILTESGNTPVEQYLLIEYRGQSNQEVRHENASDEIRMHQHIRFSALFLGGTPLS